MKNNLIFSLLSAALIALPVLSHAGEPRFDLVRTYKLADGQAVAIAIPVEWQELSKTRVLEPGSAARFLDAAGRTVEISAAALERASKSKSLVWPQEYVKTSLTAR